MISYNKQQIETMQQEAIKRVREMQKKAQQYVVNEPEKPASKSSTSTNFNSSQHVNNINCAQKPAQNATSNNNLNSNQNNIPPRNNQQNNRSSMANPFAQLFGSNMGGFNRYKNNSHEHKNPPGHTAPVEKNNLPREHSNNDPLSGINNLLKDFNFDEEKLIIIALMYLLYKNGADIKLILSLGYLLI